MFLAPFHVEANCNGVSGSVDFREIGVQLASAVRFKAEPTGAPNGPVPFQNSERTVPDLRVGDQQRAGTAARNELSAAERGRHGRDRSASPDRAAPRRAGDRAALPRGLRGRPLRHRRDTRRDDHDGHPWTLHPAAAAIAQARQRGCSWQFLRVPRHFELVGTALSRATRIAVFVARVGIMRAFWGLRSQ